MAGYSCDEQDGLGAAVVVSQVESGDVLALCLDHFAGWALSFVLARAGQDERGLVDLLGVVTRACDEANEQWEDELAAMIRKTRAARKKADRDGATDTTGTTAIPDEPPTDSAPGGPSVVQHGDVVGMDSGPHSG